MGSSNAKHHILSVLVENKAGVLTRIAGLFARRGFNIHSLAVAPTDDPTRSRISIVVDVESAPLEQMVRQLDKLVNVLAIEELAPSVAVQRELLLVRVHADDANRAGITELVARVEGRVLETDDASMLISVDADPDALDAVEQQLRAFGIEAIQRTGRIALPSLGAR